jgi:hypothetical protein
MSDPNDNDIEAALRAYRVRVARSGGQAIKQKYGNGYFSELIKKRWAKQRKKGQQP